MELKSPWELCYDRPSDKFISFLSKHYQLNNSKLRIVACMKESNI